MSKSGYQRHPGDAGHRVGDPAKGGTTQSTMIISSVKPPRPPTHQGALRVRVLPQVEESYYVGRFYPMLLAREGFSEFYREDTGNEWTGPLPLSNPDLGRPVERPRLTAKLRTHVLDKASGESSAVGRLIARGLAIDPRQVDYGGEDVWTVGNNRAECRGRDVGRMQQLIRDAARAARVQAAQRHPDSAQRHGNQSRQVHRTRAHTSARVLRAIADTVQKHVLPGDTYVDFACGNNSFGALLKDPHTNQPLPSVAFDLPRPPSAPAASSAAQQRRRNDPATRRANHWPQPAVWSRKQGGDQVRAAPLWRGRGCWS